MGIVKEIYLIYEELMTSIFADVIIVYIENQINLYAHYFFFLETLYAEHVKRRLEIYLKEGLKQLEKF